MAAAVGVRATGDGNLTAAGTFSAVPRKPAYQGQTVASTYNNGDLDMNAQMQANGTTVPIVNPAQEVTQFIGEMAIKLAVAPRAAADRIAELIQAIFTQQALV